MFTAKERCKHVFAKVKLSDGREIDGKFVIAETSDLFRTLNGEGKFVMFVTHDDDHKLIAKSSIIETHEHDMRKIKPLAAKNDNGFNAYKTLKLEPGASASEIEESYRRLSRSYHPKRYRHAEMPLEIRDYAIAMSKQIELAYSMLQTGKTVAEAS